MEFYKFYQTNQSMKNIIKFILFGLLIFGNFTFAQKTYYKINGAKPIDENGYNQVKEKIAKGGKLEELILKTETKKDSIINTVRIGIISTTPDGFDPYGETKKYIGTKFHIEKFVDENQKNFKENYLSGKPTLINFWFTRCPPCIDEIPLLNEMKDKFGDQVNFITISFNDKKTIDEFVKQQPFNFKHIYDAKKQIDDLKISAYPTSLILDKNGIVKFVFGEVTYDVKDINVILDGLQ